MSHAINTAFPHRRNPDGTFDSICTHCFTTIATTTAEAELEGAERAHTCQGFDFIWVMPRTDQQRRPIHERGPRLDSQES